MSGDASEEQAAVYATRADAYDELISAEDADGALLGAIAPLAPLDGAVVADVGAGTGRFARLVAGRASHVHLVDRAPAMLEVARRRLADAAITNVTVHVADARAMPLADRAVDLCLAGWVFGHFPHWMPASWESEVAAALAEMRRVTRPGGAVVIVETLGTGHETPRQHPLLDAYFAFLEREHGFARSWVRTDYQFPDVETAAVTCGGFFGPALAERIRSEGWSRVPECTAVLSRTW